MRNPTALRIFVFVLFFTSAFYAQCDRYKVPFFTSDYAITNWQSEDGLPQNSILSIFQTPDGFLWFGTQKGVVRFDGIKFTSYGNSKDILYSNNGIFSFAMGSDSVLWMGSHGNGIFCFRKGRFFSFPLNSQLTSQTIISLISAGNNGIYISTNSDVYRYTDRAIKLILHDTLSALKFQFTEADGRMIAVSQNGKIYRIDKDRFEIITNNNISALHVYHLIRLRDGNYFAVTASGYYTLSGNWMPSPKKIGLSIPVKDVRSVLEDNDGSLWFATITNGLYLSRGNSIIHFNVGSGLSHNFVSSLYLDAANNIWAGTLAAGVNKISRRMIKAIGKNEGLKSEFTFSIAADNENGFWIGTYGGGACYYKNGIRKTLNTKNGLCSEIIRAVFVDSKGLVYFGSYGSGLSVYNNRSIKTLTKKDGLPDDFVYAIAESPGHDIWIGTANGIGILRNGKISTLKANFGFTPVFVRSIDFDNKGDAWIGFDNHGIGRYSEGRISVIQQADGLASNYIRSVEIDKDNNAWVCSGNGLTRISGRRMFNFGTVDPLLNDLFYRCVFDDFGYCWISGNKGVLRVSKNELNEIAEGRRNALTLTQFDKSDGMLSSECNGGNTGSGLKTSDSLVLFPNLKGLIIIDPKLLRTAGTFPILHFEGLLADDNLIRTEDNHIIPAGVTRIQIDYTALCFKDPEKIKFRYKLGSNDKTTVTLGSQRSIVFYHLPPGGYDLYLYYTNEIGEWHPQPGHLYFYVSPHFYETDIFKYLALGALAVISLLLYLRRVKVLKNKQKELQMLIDQRTQTLSETNMKLETALQNETNTKNELLNANEQLREANNMKTHLLNVAAHDLKNPLNAIRGFAQILQEDFENSAEYSKMLNHIYSASSHMLALINDVLKTSTLESGKIKLNPVHFNLAALLKRHVYRNRLLAKEKGQTITAALPAELIVFSDEFRTDEIFDNLFSNAVKFSRLGGSIVVQVSSTEDFAQIIITDSGPGFTEDDLKKVFGKFEKLSALPTGGETSTGLGLSIVKDLVNMLGGKIRIDSTPGAGASVIVHLPVKEY